MQQEEHSEFDNLLEPLTDEDLYYKYPDFELENPDEDDLHPAPRDMEGQEQDRPAEDPPGQTAPADAQVSPRTTEGQTSSGSFAFGSFRPGATGGLIGPRQRSPVPAHVPGHVHDAHGTGQMIPAHPTGAENAEHASGMQDGVPRFSGLPRETIWQGATDGTENFARRTPIAITPGVGHYSAADTSYAPERVAAWQARGLTVLGFTEEQLDAMRTLRTATFEFAALSGNRYMPPGFDVEDLLRIYISQTPAVVTEHSTHLRVMAAEVLKLKAQLRMVRDESVGTILGRLDAAEDMLRQHEAQVETWRLEEGAWDAQYGSPTAEGSAMMALPAPGDPNGQLNGQVPMDTDMEEGAAGLEQPTVPAAVAAHLDAPADAGSGGGTGKLQYMRRLLPFSGNKPPQGQQQRSWDEWKGEFLHNAELCELQERKYYKMVLALLSPYMREVWLAVLKMRSEDDTWEGLDVYMTSHYSTMDKAQEAHKKFETCKLAKGTEKAWQSYANQQTASVTHMGTAVKRKYTDQGMWDEFLKGIRPVPDLYNQAFATYMRDMEDYDLLPVQSRITKITPVLLQYIKSRVATQEDGAADPGLTADQPAGGQKGTKRTADSPGTGKPAQRQKRDPRKQGESDKAYPTVPTDLDARSSPDVGFQSATESRPYSHQLRAALRAERRCLVCWSAEHTIHTCPHRSQALVQEMDASRQAPSAVLHELKSDCTDCRHDKSGMKHDPSCMNAGATTAAGVDAEAAGEAAVAGDVGAGAEADQQAAEHAVPATCVHSVQMYSREDQQGVQNSLAERQPELNTCSVPAECQNLNLIETGKYRLQDAQYIMDPVELGKIAAETRGFTRDGFTHGQVYRHPACSTDSCWVPEKPFECCDHRGHHCWMDPPVKMIDTALQSYAASKLQDPSNTSMCILVPVWRKTIWWKRIKKLQKIREYPRGAELFISGLDQTTRIQLPYKAAVFYDPPSAPAMLGAAGLQPELQHHMIFNTEINGKQSRVLLDTGASQCFISKKFCEDVNMQSVAAPTPQHVRTAGGTEILAHTLCQVSFQLQGMGITVSPLIVPIPDDFTVILGDDWLRNREAILNFADQTCSLKRNEKGKRHVLHVKKEHVVKQEKWRPDLLIIRTVEDVEDMTAPEPADFSKVPEEYRELLEKYKDIWPKDLPAGLPPLRAGVRTHYTVRLTGDTSRLVQNAV